MSKRQRTPYDPAKAERDRQERREREVEIARLEAQPDVKVTKDAARRIVAARRIDVFALLHSRGALTDEQLRSARELEEILASASGANRPEQNLDRVDGSANTGAPGQNVTQHMVDAYCLASDLLRDVGPVTAKLLTRLIDGGAVLSRWRETVHQVTGEVNERAQAAMVRAACQNLDIVLTARRYSPKAA